MIALEFMKLLGQGGKESFGNLMIIRPILLWSDWWKFIILNRVIGRQQIGLKLGNFLL